MRLRGAHWGLALIQMLLALSAIPAGWLFVSDPSGGRMGMSVSGLEGPFSDFLVPGLYLLALIGLGNLAAAAASLLRGRGFRQAAQGLGLALMAFIAGQWIWMRDTLWLQPLCFGLGAAEAALGFFADARQTRR